MLRLPDLHSWLDTFLMASALVVAVKTLRVAKKPEKKEKRPRRVAARRKRR